MPDLIPNPTQCQRVLNYLDMYNSINFNDARIVLRISKLAARIWELEKKGFQFDRERVPFYDSYNGKNSYYIEYSLAIKEGQQEMAL